MFDNAKSYFKSLYFSGKWARLIVIGIYWLNAEQALVLPLPPKNMAFSGLKLSTNFIIGGSDEHLHQQQSI